MKRAAFSIFMLAVLLAGCASGKRPQWVDTGDHPKYSHEHYYLVVVKAADVKAAKIAGRNAIVRKMKLRISKRYADGALPGYADLKKVGKIINARLDPLVSGMKLVAVYRDPETKQMHALLALAHKSAANNLHDEVRAFDEITQKSVKIASDARNPARTRLIAASNALHAQIARIAYVDAIAGMDVKIDIGPARFRVVELSQGMARVLGEVTLRLFTRNDKSGLLMSDLNESMKSAGFKAGPNLEEPTFHLEAELTMNDEGKVDGWDRAQGTLRIQLSEPHGQPFGAYRWSIRSAGRDPADARKRLQLAITKLMAKQMSAVLLRFMTKQTAAQ